MKLREVLFCPICAATAAHAGDAAQAPWVDDAARGRGLKPGASH